MKRQQVPDPFSTEAVDAAAKAWWEALRAGTGVGVPWDEASDDAKDATREYVLATGGA